MDDLTIKRAGPISYFVFPALERLEFLRHAFSTRGGGVSPLAAGALNLGYIAEDAPENVRFNRAQFLAAIGQADATLCTLHQVHSSQIHILNNAPPKTKPFLPDPSRIGEGDGLVSGRPGHLLGIQTADCLPIFLIDPRQPVVANLHAGWRGTCRRIVQHGVTALQENFGSRPADLIAAIGPGIGVCCYEVGEEVVAEFRNEFGYAEACFQRRNGTGRWHLDLATANQKQLIESGLSENQILQARRCTACEPDCFFSYRREKGMTGRMMAVVGLRTLP